jgi:hypothetical protein
MQSVHTTRYMIRTMRGHYVKTNTDEGIGYVMFRTKPAAKAWAAEWGEDCYVVTVRAAITPTISGRTERMVAVRETRPQEISAKYKVEHNFYP